MISWCGGYFYHPLSSSTNFSKIMLHDSTWQTKYSAYFDNFIYEGYCSYPYSKQSNSFLENLESQSFTTENQLFSSPLPLFCMDLCTLLLRRAAPPSGGWPPPASDGGRGLGLCSYIIDVNMSVYHYAVNQSVSASWLSWSRSDAQLTEWCLATSGLTPHECYHPSRTVCCDADYVASLHSAPNRLLYCLYSESGLFWAIQLTGNNNPPLLLKIWRIIHSSRTAC